MFQICTRLGLSPVVVPALKRRKAPNLVRASGVPREAIEGAVAQVFGIAHDDLGSATRGQAGVALARQVAMYLAHIACGLTLTEVGRLFARDRTTVAHACGVIEDRRDDPTFDRVLDLLEWITPTLVLRRCAIRRLDH